MTLRKLDVRLGNDLAEMDRLLDEIDSFAGEAHLPASTAYRIQLAADEFVANAVEHGYPDGRRGEVHICAVVKPDVVEMTLSDDGDPFDPQSAPPPDLGASIEERRIGGLGIHLVRKMASEFAYRRADGRNIITLTLPIEAACPPRGFK